MIGMKQLKDDIFDMIIYYLQEFEKNNKSMLHTVIEGPPGVGKTRVGKILAQIYCALGILPSDKFKYVKSTDLIGDHVGATKHMTQKILDEADGGVLFIDEAYALSTDEKKDPYGQECIDTLNFNLSENKKKLIIIIAGYPEQLEQHFFSLNPGLHRRFPFRFKIDGYTSSELRDIFLDKMRKFKWKLNNHVTLEKLELFFKHNMNEFKNYGGDVENFFKNCQFSHSRRVIGKHPYLRMKLTNEDLEAGLKRFKNNKVKDTSSYPNHMYI
jgi:SpoVK/Ycf46/Vps4 family AAA+-type ATPase